MVAVLSWRKKSFMTRGRQEFPQSQMIDTGAKQIPTGETPDFEPKQQQQDVDISMCMSAYIKTDSARRCTTKVGVPSELHYRVAHDMSSKNL